MNRDATQALGEPEIVKRLLALGLQPVPGTSTDFAGFIDSEVAKWGALVKTRGIVLE
ncbi:Tripartite tricarboxylate transporter family receptor [compost metagenome]